MAQSELTQSEYSNLKSALETLSDNKAANEYHVGKRRVAMVRRSKSYAGYLQIRRNEQRKAAENRPARPTPGTSELSQENQEFLAQTNEGESLPADKVAANGDDLRTAKEKAAAEAAKADRAKEAEARRLNAEYVRQQRINQIGSYITIAFAIIGVVATAWFLLSLVF